MILCVTHSQDFYNIDIIMDYFAQKGIPAVRFNTDLYPSEIDIQLNISSKGKEIIASSDTFSFNTNEIKGVWMRKLWRSKVLEEVDESYRQGVGNEIRTVMHEFLHAIQSNVPTVNNLAAESRVDSNKHYQLIEAMNAQLIIPKTLISSNYNKVKEFYQEVNGSMIAKLQKPLGFSMGQSDNFFPTTQITPEYLEMMENTLAICPMMFQELIPKAYELRIAYVDGQCFSGKINATKTKDGTIDWRNTETAGTVWEPYQLPKYLEEQLQQLMDKLNLTIGAIDIIRKPNGEYVFLEVNPSGEWGMLQKFLNYPIAEAIAKAILKKIK